MADNTTPKPAQAPYADTADAHSLRSNPDPAMDPANQHHHAHKNHAASAQPQDDAVYTTGTSVDHSTVAHPYDLHDPRHHSHHVTDKGTPVHDKETASRESHEGSNEKIGAHPPDYVDQEKGTTTGVHAHDAEPASTPRWAQGRWAPIYRRRRPLIHFIILGLFTGWWMASLILHRDDKNWVVPFLLWLAITLRIIFFYVPSRYISNPIKYAWKNSAVRVYDALPSKARTPAGAAVAIAAILVGTFVSEETADNTRANRAVSLFGILVIVAAFWASSRSRRHVNWRTVIGGMLAQFVIGIFVLRTGVGYDIFKFIADRAGNLLGFARDGVAFLTSQETAETPWFFFGVIPAIIFFISLVQVLYYIGFLQWFIIKFATFVFWMLGVSGAEAVVAAATPFIGQGESAMLVRPFVPHMTKAELHQIMTCGFATISGSVLVGYIGLGLNAEVLVSSCIMSIPASLAMSKLRYPETEEALTAGRVVIPDDDEHKAENALHAFANGAWLGLKIAGSIITSILCILAAVGLVNGLMTWWGRYLNINDPELTLQAIFGYVFYPVAFLLGVPRENGDLLKVSRLIAEKFVTNEYVAFSQLKVLAEAGELSQRSKLIATYACCGFGNIGSLGIQIGILGQLAPSRGGDVSRLAISALITGVFSTLTSAAVAGLVITHQIDNFVGN